VIGIWPRHALVDGGVTTQPEFSFWFKDVGWSIENHGAEPDIEVEIPPHIEAKEEDPQLDRGIEEIRKLLDQHEEKLPDLKSKPKLG
jgi:tricorn protease